MTSELRAASSSRLPEIPRDLAPQTPGVGRHPSLGAARGGEDWPSRTSSWSRRPRRLPRRSAAAGLEEDIPAEKNRIPPQVGRSWNWSKRAFTRSYPPRIPPLPPNKGAKKSTFAFVRLLNDAVDAAGRRWMPLYNRTRQNRTAQLASLEESIGQTKCAPSAETNTPMAEHVRRASGDPQHRPPHRPCPKTSQA